jgi:hypothetical protein
MGLEYPPPPPPQWSSLGEDPAYWGKYSFFFLVKFYEYYFSLV